MRLSCLEAPTPPDQGDISGQSTRFSTTNTALRAVKETEEHDESHVDFTRHCSKTSVTQRTQFSIALILPGSTHNAGSRWYLRGLDRLFHHEHGLGCGQRDKKDVSNQTVTSPESWSSPQLQQAHFSIGFYISCKHPCSFR